MNTTWKTICLAIRASLFKETQSFPVDVNWDDVFMESKKQAIASIVRAGVKNSLPSSLALSWNLFSAQEVGFTVQLMNAQRELTELLEYHGINYKILKGTAAAIYYPEPYYRTMGDIDFWVLIDQFDSACDIVAKNGYTKSLRSDERHIKLIKNNILFEMHRHVSNTENDKPLDLYIERAGAERGCIRDTEFWMLPELENGLVLLNHLRQHLIEGLGIRQVLDWMMYCDRCIDAEKWQEMLPFIRKLGLEKLAITTTHLCVMHFGLKVDWCEGEDELSELLLESIIQSGNFGKIHGNGRNVERVYVNIKKKGLIRYLQQAGEANWIAVQKHSWLRPFAWIYQIGRYIIQALDSGRIGSRLKEDMRRSNNRYELLKRLELL